ncbi:hypothetical protein JZM24_17375 [Candidatus Sodalis endolongispinus]|uniref:Uncharacterized protein n=1 Tax=Candidatus Sodalis endolongispinus TaxID=2812662 RepID=A0ABS5YEK9_9GAMM|nr:hypothetical protein [Candidatus Sodalis endolongispinus]MBT9433418.1 hypothetical protein [Candidatus Sodalis endolongispinus]
MKSAFYALLLLAFSSVVWSNNEEQALPLVKLAINAMDAGYFSEPGNLKITQWASGENPTSATVEIEKDLVDDSIAIEKIVFKMQRQNDIWVIDSHSTTFKCKCRKGRGHQTLSPACCH